jgi:hypothetical protein
MSKIIVPEQHVWIPVVGYESIYSVSSSGQVRNSKTEKFLTPRPVRSRSQLEKDNTQYWTVGLYKDGVRKNKKIHRVVCRAFHGEPPTEKYEVGHWDNDTSNNSKDNVYWTTHKDNLDHHPDGCACPYCKSKRD